MTRIAVVGHVEWVDFVPVERFPDPGEIIHAHGPFARAAGGGGVVAVMLAEMGADVDFYCALGRDELGRAAAAQLGKRGVRVHVAWREEPTRRAVTLLDPENERTIITMGERLQPLASDALDWDRLRGADGVYMTAGDAGAMEHARQARVLVVSPRARSALGQDGPMIDALIYSSRDAGEREWARRIEHRVRLHVATDGARGGSWWGESEGSWAPAPPPGRPRDAYGCGDSFAAGVTFGLGSGSSMEDAAALGAQWGALALTRPGAP